MICKSICVCTVYARVFVEYTSKISGILDVVWFLILYRKGVKKFLQIRFWTKAANIIDEVVKKGKLTACNGTDVLN